MPTINGTSGNDTLNGTVNADIINGIEGDDTIDGGSGDDTIDGGDGNDTITDGAGSDTIHGGAGGDTIFASVGAGGDVYDGGTNESPYQDYVSYQAALAGVIVDLSLSADHARSVGGGDAAGIGIDQLINIEAVIGSEFGDTLTGSSANNALSGRGGNDTLSGGDGNDRLNGGFGNDTVDGGAGVDWANFYGPGVTSGVNVSLAIAGPQDTGQGIDTLIGIEELIGTFYHDVLTGDTGANYLLGAEGDDELFGGAGIDTLDGDYGNDYLDGGAGADEMYGYVGNDTYVIDDAGDQIFEDYDGDLGGVDTVIASISYSLSSSNASVENLTLAGAAVSGAGTDLNNIVRGNDAANELSGFGGADILYGNGGNDVLDGGTADDKLFGGLGNDTLIGGTGYDRMYGAAGDDIYYANDATDFAYENVGEGHDTVIASLDHQLRAEVEDLELTGSAIIGKGNAEDNRITGNANDNKLYGYDGDDYLDGYSGDDFLLGGNGTDQLAGGSGTDRLYGGLGDDLYYVEDATDYVYENAGDGSDIVRSNVSYTLRANVEHLALNGEFDINGTGNELNNLVQGNFGANVLSGRGGDDTLYGLDGDDRLAGGDGNDWVSGNAGRDRLSGESGADTFQFGAGDFAGMTSSTCDQIYDFNRADGDKIRLQEVDANSGLAGDQAFAFIGSGAFTGTAGELRYQQISGQTYVQGDTDGDGQADFWIRLDGLHTMVNSDFVL